jgi:hypothetical protein
MSDSVYRFSCEVELLPGEKLSVPESLANAVGAGRWLITVEPAGSHGSAVSVLRHDAFLRGYAPDDEGLYDDRASR